MRAFVLGLSRMIREEKAVYGQISDEEWEVIRPTKQERCDEILASLKEHLLEHSKCDICLSWRIDSAEIWGDTYTQNSFESSKSLLVG
jgi:glutamate receptor, ionotropic, invertebrate